MTDSPDHHRRSLRLKDYDYARAGAYFVTVCAQDRACLFGDIVDGAMHLSEPGQMVQTVWDDLPNHYAGVETDAFIVMPNHVHGIVVLVGAAPVAALYSGRHRSWVRHRGLPLRCLCRMWCIVSKR